MKIDAGDSTIELGWMSSFIFHRARLAVSAIRAWAEVIMAGLPAGDQKPLVLKTIATYSTYMLSDQLYRRWSTGFEHTLLTADRSQMTLLVASGWK